MSVLRKAYCKENAPLDTVIDCYLDIDDPDSTVIAVNCSVVDGSGSENLNGALPRLTIGDLLIVTKLGEDWWCLTVFEANENCICSEGL